MVDVIGKDRAFNSMALFLILVPLFKPAGLGQIPVLNLLFQLGKAASLVIILILLLGNLRKYRFNMLELSIAIFWVSYAIGCYQSESGYDTVLNYSMTSLALLMLFKIEASSGQIRDLLNVLWWIFTPLLLLQAASLVVVSQGVILFPSDYTHMYLFGEDNYSAFMVLPMMTMVLYSDSVNDGKGQWKHRITMLAFLSVLIAYVYVQSVAASLGFLLMGLCYVGKDKLGTFVHCLTPKRIAIVFLALLMLVLVFHVQDFIGQIVSSFLDKNIFTLNSRTTIWSQAEGLIASKPLFGWGDGLTEAMIWGGHAHNALLQLLTACGVVGTCSFFLYVGLAYIDAGRALVCGPGSILVGALAAMAVLSFFDFYIGISALFCLIAFVAVVPGALETENSVGDPSACRIEQ